MASRLAVGPRTIRRPSAHEFKLPPSTHAPSIAKAASATVRHLLFVIDLKTRRVDIAGIAAEPYEDCVRNMVRGLLDPIDGFLLGARHLILDRDPVFTKSVRHMLQREGINVVRLPPKSPNLSSYAERFIGSVRRECLSKIIPLGERHLRKILVEYGAHYHIGRLYNFVTFNSGLHTAHHIRPSLHWSELPEYHKTIENKIPPELLI